MWFSFFRNCRCCVEAERAEEEQESPRSPRKQSVDDSTSIAHKILLIHKNQAKPLTWDLDQISKIYEMSAYNVILKYMIPCLDVLYEDKIINQANYITDAKGNHVKLDPILTDIIGQSKDFFHSATKYKWTANIHQDCFEKILVKWFLFKRAIQAGQDAVFIEKYRFVHRLENGGETTKYTFSYCYSERGPAGQITHCTGKLFEVNQPTWFEIEL